jgi:hypothetical protein
MVHKFGVEVGKLKPIKVIYADKDIVDSQGWTISKGTKMYVMKEASIKHPTLGVKHFVVVRIDNGTGVLELMPETAFEFTK